MADKKLEKALYGPSLTEVILGAILGLLAGVAVACIYLVFKPVPMVKEIPKEPARGMVYYLPGSESKAKSRTWEAKQKQFLAGTPVTVVEDELNAWMTTLQSPAAKPAAPGAAAPAPEGYVIPGPLNFRLIDGKLQIGLPCTLNWYGLATDVTVQMIGVFRESGAEFVFVPEKVYLGSCPLHVVPALPGLLVNHILEKQKIPDETRAAWAKLKAVSIEGATLKLAAQ